MTNYQKWALTSLRVGLGWLFFYAGITKIFDPTWSAGVFLSNASTFPEMYEFFAHPDVLPIVNLLNEWGLTLLGVSLITGVLVRVSAPLGVLLMLLYYLASLDFPMVGEHSYIVNDHIIKVLALLTLVAFNAGRYKSLGTVIRKGLKKK
ncbi:MAG: DoxX family protein [Candidatus Campbellbacteria bacterium]|nr:DoxX family protein [Candidatus Campbellbacteria bacterium]